MEVADHLAVVNHGRLEQVGAPRELYDEPVNDFVLTFVGPATSIRGEFVRPHDVEIVREPLPGSHPATVLRVVHLGFEVRIELRLDAEGDDAGSFAWAQLERERAQLLNLVPGDRVHVVAAETRAEPDLPSRVDEAVPTA